MTIALLVAVAALVPGAQESQRPRLVTEDLEGRAGVLETSALPLKDPREKGWWILRPRGFPALPAQDRDASVTAQVTLVNGDELRAQVLGGHGEVLELGLVGGVSVPFDLENLRSLVFTERIPKDQRLGLAAPAEGDRLYRKTLALDAIDGTLQGFEADGVSFDGVLGQRTFPWSEVGALFIESLDGEATNRATPGIPVQIGLGGAGGGRVRGGLLELGAERCRVVLGGRVEVELPLQAVEELVVADGRLTFLSELVPAEELGRGAPFGDELGMIWPHRMDRSVIGAELRAGGEVVRHGIGMHAPSSLRFELEGEWRLLRGSVAIDDSALVNAASARGSVVFRVRAGDALLWESPVVRGGDPPLSLPPLELGGRRELVLEVDPAGDFAGDRADWLELALVR